MMVAKAMWLNVPLRGAIAYGRCIVSLDPIYYLGQPILDAYALEHRQQWAGVSLCDTAEQLLAGTQSLRLVRCEVPIKSGVDPRQVVPTSMLVVDWPACSFGPRMKVSDPTSGELVPGPSPNWAACFASARQDVVVKREWTEKFFHVRDVAGAFGGATFGPEQRGLVSSWRELYRNR
jgi:hypothetical protein